MAWDFAHKSVIWDYWMNGGIKDFGPLANNTFIKRVGEMMGEEDKNAPWTLEMKQAFVPFLTLLYPFPPEFAFQGTTFSGQPKYTDAKAARTLATALKNGTKQLKLRMYGIKDSRLAVLLRGGPYVGPTADKEFAADQKTVRDFMRIWMLRGFIPVAATTGSDITGQPKKRFIDRFSQTVQKPPARRGPPPIVPLVGPSSVSTPAELGSLCRGVVSGGAKFAWRGDQRSWTEVGKASGLHAKVISNSKAYLNSTNLGMRDVHK